MVTAAPRTPRTPCAPAHRARRCQSTVCAPVSDSRQPPRRIGHFLSRYRRGEIQAHTCTTVGWVMAWKNIAGEIWIFVAIRATRPGVFHSLEPPDTYPARPATAETPAAVHRTHQQHPQLDPGGPGRRGGAHGGGGGGSKASSPEGGTRGRVRPRPRRDCRWGGPGTLGRGGALPGTAARPRDRQPPGQHQGSTRAARQDQGCLRGGRVTVPFSLPQAVQGRRSGWAASNEDAVDPSGRSSSAVTSQTFPFSEAVAPRAPPRPAPRRAVASRSAAPARAAVRMAVQPQRPAAATTTTAATSTSASTVPT